MKLVSLRQQINYNIYIIHTHTGSTKKNTEIGNADNKQENTHLIY